MKLGRDNYNRVYELLVLIDALRQSMAGLSYDDICEKIGWERRTAERMMKIVETHYWDSFIKMRGDDRKIYFRLSNKEKFPPNCISENEIVALRTALGFVKNNEPLKLPLERLAGKLTNLKSGTKSNIEDMMIVSGTASAPRPYIKVSRKILEPLQHAVLAQKTIRIKYAFPDSGKFSTQTLCPLGFLYGVQDNYLIASYIGDVKHPRHYKLSNIESVKLLKDYFVAENFDIRKYAAKSFGTFIDHTRSRGYNVKWRVKPEAAARAKRFVFHPTQKISRQRDGSLIIEFTADGLREMAWHLMTWEGMIQPLAPRELVAEYKEQLRLAGDALVK